MSQDAQHHNFKKQGVSAQQCVHVQLDVGDASVLIWYNHDQTRH